MNAYKVTLRLFERDEYDEEAPWEAGDDVVQLVTVAKSLDVAAKFVPEAYKKADDTAKYFDWKVVAVETIEGLVALPPFKTGVAPKT